MADSSKPTTIRFPAPLKKRLRQAAAEDDTTMEAIIERAYLDWESARTGEQPEAPRPAEDSDIEVGLSSREKALLRKFVEMLQTEHSHPLLKDLRDSALKGITAWHSALEVIRQKDERRP